jgi:hypothetical protein
MQAVLEREFTGQAVSAKENSSLGKKMGLIAKLFGCWHRKVTRPITSGNLTYMACVECGARQMFDSENFKVSRAFYYPPSVSFDRN